MKRIYLIDCPGVVPPSNNDTEEDILLRGVVRVENVENPAQYVPAVLRRTQPRHIERTYDIKGFDGDAIEFLSILARKGGRLLKGGEPDLDGVAKMVLNDFLRGKIPWYTPPPKREGETMEDDANDGVEGREGRLGEMGKKRKREDLQTVGSRNDEAAKAAAKDTDDDVEDHESVTSEEDEEGEDDDNDEDSDEESLSASEGGVDIDDISGAEDSE